MFNGKEVPEVLLSGHHANIDKWRLEKSLELTKERRPDLYEKYIENTEKRLEEFLLEVKGIKKVEVIISTEYKSNSEDGIYYIKGAVIACTNGNDDKTKAEI